MVEYGVIVALIAVVAMVAVQTLGTGVAGVFTRVVNRITGIG
jgi:Flp pilus assembly pilin Flp